MTKNIHIIGGGTIFHIRNHLALSAPAYGKTAKTLYEKFISEYDVTSSLRGYQFFKERWDLKDENNKYYCHLTKMADPLSSLETNQDVEDLVDKLIADPETKVIVFNPALVDYEAHVIAEYKTEVFTKSGKYETRLKTSEGCQKILLSPQKKILSKIRKERKDIFLVAFKTTCGATEDEQFLTGLNLLKSNSCNLVLANDTKTRLNMIITPEQARYEVTKDRNKVLETLVKMTVNRSQLTFTRSTIIPGESIKWSSDAIPDSLRKVVNHCIEKGAYKPFNGSTAGHFAVKVDDNRFLTSKRKVDFNKLSEVGLVEVVSKDKDSVIAYGSKPSVGGMSQRIIFKEHPGYDCIAHFHCKPRDGVKISTKPQQMLECGSHQCGQNTSNGLELYENGIKAVYLDNHGPNIVFKKDIDPQLVIDFIDKNFDLSESTDEVDRSIYNVT